MTVAFGYVRPPSVAEANDAGRAAGARFIAGGTTLVDLLRLGVERPQQLVDLGALDWTKIEPTPQGLRIGALVRNTELAYHPLVQRQYPALSQALLSGASPQLRNMATLGGNLLQRTRCSYFRDVAVQACNKRAPGSGCAAIAGYHRMHAVLGTSAACIATHPSDMCVALYALDAVVHTRGPSGERSFPVADLHALPGEHPEREHVLEPGELIIGVTLPSSALSTRSVYVKARDRASYAFALASAAVALELDGQQIKQARVALGGVATKPWRSQEAERALQGKTASATLFEQAASEAMRSAKPLRDNAYKVALAQRVLVRALSQATGVA